MEAEPCTQVATVLDGVVSVHGSSAREEHCYELSDAEFASSVRLFEGDIAEVIAVLKAFQRAVDDEDSIDLDSAVRRVLFKCSGDLAILEVGAWSGCTWALWDAKTGGYVQLWPSDVPAVVELLEYLRDSKPIDACTFVTRSVDIEVPRR